jgi:Mrp family chromosome partitioning ATPase
MGIGAFISRSFNKPRRVPPVSFGGIRLLGILPNLPDRTSDPLQAGIASHCVQQVRKMLLANSKSKGPNVTAITSATKSDGKTSLSLALALSHAELDINTLLIDCDYDTADLTRRLNNSVAEGPLESVLDGSPLSYVRQTGIANLSILPLGTVERRKLNPSSHDASHRLFDECRKHFGAIVVDTGPILANTDAAIACAAADRTILIVARNQQRPTVEKAITKLVPLGNDFAGVVFNRWTSGDISQGPGNRRMTPGNPKSEGMRKVRKEISHQWHE